MRRLIHAALAALLVCTANTNTNTSVYPESSRVTPGIELNFFPPITSAISPALVASPFAVAEEEVGQLIPYTYQLAARFSYNQGAAGTIFGSAALVRYQGTVYGVTAAHTVMYQNSSLLVLVKKVFELFISKTRSLQYDENPILTDVFLRDYRGTIFSCTVCKLLPQIDVATLQINESALIRPETIIEDIADRTSDQEDEPIYLCGWHAGRFFVQQGQTGKALPFIRVHDLGLVHDVVSARVPIAPGFSGGPVLTTNRRLLGVASCGKADSTPLCHFTSLESIRYALSD